ncbi:hypothetical protein [Haloarcula hispanica pleomorphic virus 4]|uniref:Uncharacterized protein n=1 Tax=Haloarcula hispanica pleomorphic virus 4 TaxID=1980140 RepID=A0A2P0QGX0_9VIRU|nr:hypothetical protein HOS97_gp05 [Haloarcula hispanica pleomorphic virus 4]ARM71119.1 hypothetical protein [Haloarcula hispanica pleomorphic virus 4]
MILDSETRPNALLNTFSQVTQEIQHYFLSESSENLESV